MELTKLGEQRVEEGKIEDDLLDALGAPWHWPIFVPSKIYIKNDRVLPVHLVQGYVFVASGLPADTYFSLEHDRRKIVNKVLSERRRGTRIIGEIGNDYIRRLRKKLSEEINSDIKEGVYVRITGGSYMNLEGQVVDVGPEKAQVRIELRSIMLITQVPKLFLELL